MAGDEMNEQDVEWMDYKKEMRKEVKRLSNHNIIMGKDIKTLLAMAEEFKKAHDDLIVDIYKGPASIMTRLARHDVWIGIGGLLFITIAGAMATAYVNLTAAPPIVAVEVTSSK